MNDNLTEFNISFSGLLVFKLFCLIYNGTKTGTSNQDRSELVINGNECSLHIPQSPKTEASP